LLNEFAVGQEVKIDLNLRGREWINQEGIAKYFNAIQGWRIELLSSQEPKSNSLSEMEPVCFLDDDDPNNDLPF